MLMKTISNQKEQYYVADPITASVSSQDCITHSACDSLQLDVTTHCVESIYVI